MNETLESLIKQINDLAIGNHGKKEAYCVEFAQNNSNGDLREYLKTGGRLLLIDNVSSVTLTEEGALRISASPLAYGRIMGDYERNANGIMRRYASLLTSENEEKKSRGRRKKSEDKVEDAGFVAAEEVSSEDLHNLDEDSSTL